LLTFSVLGENTLARRGTPSKAKKLLISRMVTLIGSFIDFAPHPLFANCPHAASISF